MGGYVAGVAGTAVEYDPVVAYAVVAAAAVVGVVVVVS